jgi:uncharacterized protein (TIGR00159 family)
MNEIIATVSASFRWIDILDILLVAFLVYRILLLIRGTNAVQMLTGLGVLGVAFLASLRFELFTLNWLLAHFFNGLILIIIVLFQDDLRRALTYVGKNPFFTREKTEEDINIIEETARAAFRMAKERIGALIVIERETGLKNFIDTGAKIDAEVRAELIYSIFIPSSPIHDGAVIISEGRIAAAGCFLPLSKNPNIDKKYGTRHRAAIGITEETDALVILVSEEAGQAHFVKDGIISMNLSEEELKSILAVEMGVTMFTSVKNKTKKKEKRISVGIN